MSAELTELVVWWSVSSSISSLFTGIESQHDCEEKKPRQKQEGQRPRQACEVRKRIVFDVLVFE